MGPSGAGCAPVADRLGHLFPSVCGQAAYNRRLRRAAPPVAQVLRALAVACPSWWDQGGCWTPPPAALKAVALDGVMA
jgi:hypothetical protein